MRQAAAIGDEAEKNAGCGKPDKGAGKKNEGVGEHVRVEVHRGSAASDCGDLISTPYEECLVAEPSFRRMPVGRMSDPPYNPTG